jgi:hypothetical protein
VLWVSMGIVGISASLWVGGGNEIREVREIRDCP